MAKRKFSAKQLAAQEKFKEMVQAKAAKRGKTGGKKAAAAKK